jgi:3-oxoacyl-[acyl-carrier-protein] synthase-1
MKVTRDLGLDARLLGPDRKIELGHDAAQEALAPLLAHDIPVSILLSTGEARPGQPDSQAAALYAGLTARLAEQIPIGRGGVRASGHAGGLLAMAHATAVLRSGQARLCLVGGVDSYLDPQTLDWLDETERLHSEGNIYGFCPGEGAGFCLLATLETAHALNLRPLLELVAVWTAQEESRIGTDTVCLGIGLGAAFRSAFKQAEGLGAAHRIISDMNGERYRGNEYGFAVLRNPGRFGDAAAFETPADCWGDVGAASGPLFAMLASEAAARDYAPGPLTLAWASSENGSRAAALLRGPPGGR